MDYKYITQLLERYWQAETTVEEENILRAFFSQTSIPEELEQYRCLFLYGAATSTAACSHSWEKKRATE